MNTGGENVLAYAEIHNEGGDIVVTKKMKKFFWAMFYKTSGRVSRRNDGENRRTKRNKQLSEEAEFWQNLALKKEGDTIKIPQRQYIGETALVKNEIEKTVSETFERLLNI